MLLPGWQHEACKRVRSVGADWLRHSSRPAYTSWLNKGFLDKAGRISRQCLTIACKRRPIASARTSLRPLGAPEAWRSAPRGGRGLAGARGGRQGPAPAGVSGGGGHPSGVSVVSGRHRAPWQGGREGGGAAPPALTAVPVRAVGVSSCAACPAPRACGGLPQTVCPPTVRSAASIPGVRSAPDSAGGSVPSGRGRGREAGGRCGCSSRVRRGWGGTGPCLASRGVRRPWAQGSGAAAAASATLSGASSVCAEVRAACVPRGGPPEGAPQGPAGTGQAGSRGRSGAEQRRAGDRQQPPLVPRSGHWRRLTPSVRPKFHRSGKEVYPG